MKKYNLFIILSFFLIFSYAQVFEDTGKISIHRYEKEIYETTKQDSAVFDLEKNNSVKKETNLFFLILPFIVIIVTLSVIFLIMKNKRKIFFLFLLFFPLIKIFPSIHYEDYKKNLKNVYWGYPGGLKVEFEEKSSKGLVYNYYGYLPYWIDTLYYANFQYDLLTHISYFSIDVNSDGSLGSFPNPSRFTKIYNDAHKRGVKVHLTFTLFGTTSVSTLLNSKTSRDNCINSILNYVNAYSLDGVNIDFEFVSSSVRDSFTLFIQELATKLHTQFSRRKELYIAVPPVYQWYPGYNYIAISTYADGLFVMCYDYHWSGSTEAGPVAPTFNSSFWGYYAVNTSINDILSLGVDPEKLVLGIPYYGYDWPTESDTLKSKTTGTASSVIFKNAKVYSSNYGRKFDNYSKTPYYTYYSTSYHQCFYDDSSSIRYKLGIVKDKKLQGAGCWALGYDDGTIDLWTVLREEFFLTVPLKHFIVEVNTSNLNVRTGPSTFYDILNISNYGEKFVAFDYDGYWYKIYYPSASFPYYAYVYGGDGVNLKYLEGDNSFKVARITASLLNVRSGPSTTYPVLTQVAYNQVFVVDSFTGGWVRIILPDSNRTGFIYYTSYAQIFDDLSSFNDCEIFIDSIIYPDTVFSGDSFEVKLYLKNTGYVSLDSIFGMSFSEKSLFFYENFWTDSTFAKSYGNNTLPGQNGIKTFYFKAPFILNDSLLSYDVVLKRNDDTSSNYFNIKIYVKSKSSGKVEDDKIFCEENFKTLRKFYHVYDLTGRLIKKGDGEFNITDVKKFSTGVYFVIFSDGQKINRKKIIMLK
ncbi:MAG: glycosyl hydrolase family 18 protein [candidate division WOR-3 bacterium]